MERPLRKMADENEKKKGKEEQIKSCNQPNPSFKKIRCKHLIQGESCARATSIRPQNLMQVFALKKINPPIRFTWNDPFAENAVVKNLEHKILPLSTLC